jgi:hypothetical protein
VKKREDGCRQGDAMLVRVRGSQLVPVGVL